MLRLKTRPQFQSVLAGKIVAKTDHFALHRTALAVPSTCVNAFEPSTLIRLFATDGVWMGAMVPKRWAKRAVTRNAIKRQIYSVSASFGDALPASAHVVRLRKAFDRSIYVSATSDAFAHAVRVEIESLLGKAVGCIAKPS